MVELIVAGLGRSGTTSLANALPMLGMQVLSQETLFAKPDLHAHINAVARGTSPLDANLLKGVDATVGWPLCWTVEQQMARFPEARVLLNIREPESWYDSISRAMKTVSIVRKLRFMPKLRHINETMDILFEQMGTQKMEPKQAWLEGYQAHLQAVKAVVPTSKLLVYDVQEGWEPLCAFLGVPIPKEPFPRENVGGGESLREKLSRLFGIGANESSSSA